MSRPAAGRAAAPPPDEVPLEQGDARLVAECGGTCWRPRSAARTGRLVLPVDVVKVLGAGVIGLQVGIRQGPFRRDSVHVLDGLEVALTEPEQHGAVELGVPADVTMLCAHWIRSAAPLVAGGLVDRHARLPRLAGGA